MSNERGAVEEPGVHVGEVTEGQDLAGIVHVVCAEGGAEPVIADGRTFWQGGERNKGVRMIDEPCCAVGAGGIFEGGEPGSQGQTLASQDRGRRWVAFGWDQSK